MNKLQPNTFPSESVQPCTVYCASSTLRHLLLILLFFLPTILITAQSRQDLSKKRKRLLVEIEQASQLLSSTKKDKAAALGQYYTLHRQVKKRHLLIATLQKEIELSEESIERTSLAVNALQEDMERLKKEYGEMARKACRAKMNDEKLLFLFSAEGLSDGLKRWRYLQQYDDYRKKQAGLILETKNSLSIKLGAVGLKNIEQQDLLAASERQQYLLQKELRLKNKILKGLVANESKISKLIGQKRRAHRQLSLAIENIIATEINKRRKKNKVNTSPSAANSTKTKTTSTPTSVTKNKKDAYIAKYTREFKSQKGKLNWPVKNGIITRHFGKQAHPIHKKIMITNNGIDIKATINNKVTAIFNGKVAGFQYVPGYQNTLIIQHGDYYSVYSNLEKINVKRGNIVKRGQLLGIAGINSENAYLEVHLEIWKGKQRLNPAVWLAR